MPTYEIQISLITGWILFMSVSVPFYDDLVNFDNAIKEVGSKKKLTNKLYLLPIKDRKYLCLLIKYLCVLFTSQEIKTLNWFVNVVIYDGIISVWMRYAGVLKYFIKLCQLFGHFIGPSICIILVCRSWGLLKIFSSYFDARWQIKWIWCYDNDESDVITMQRPNYVPVWWWL